MRLIFLDESARDRSWYFMGALIADAAAIRSIEGGLEGIATLIAAHNADFDPCAEFHAVDMFHGKNGWSDVPLGWRVKACVLVSKVIARSTARFVFRGVDLLAHKETLPARPAHLRALSDVLDEIDAQLHQLDPVDELGLVLADDHHTADSARRSLRDVKLERGIGRSDRRLARIADTLYFGPSHESRMLQATDVATFFFNREHTVVERDERSAMTVRGITERIRLITVSELVGASGQTQRPTGERGVGWVREARGRPAPPW